MLYWPPYVIKYTVGLGGIGMLIPLVWLSDHLHLSSWLTLAVVLLPAMILLFDKMNVLPDTIARTLLWVAVGWYFALATLSLIVAAYRGFIALDLFFVGFVLIGAWPCILVVRNLLAARET